MADRQGTPSKLEERNQQQEERPFVRQSAPFRVQLCNCATDTNTLNLLMHTLSDTSGRPRLYCTIYQSIAESMLTALHTAFRLSQC